MSDLQGEPQAASSKREGWTVPSSSSALICGARSAVTQSSWAGATSSRSLAAVSTPLSPTRQTQLSPKRRRSLPTWGATVLACVYTWGLGFCYLFELQFDGLGGYLAHLLEDAPCIVRTWSVPTGVGWRRRWA